MRPRLHWSCQIDRQKTNRWVGTHPLGNRRVGPAPSPVECISFLTAGGSGPTNFFPLPLGNLKHRAKKCRLMCLRWPI